MNIDIKMIRYYINYELVAHILLILNVILFTIMISTGHPVVGSICSMLLSILGFLRIQSLLFSEDIQQTGVDEAFADWLDVNNHFEPACFRSAKKELGKFSEFVAHDLVVPPVSTELQ